MRRELLGGKRPVRRETPPKIAELDAAEDHVTRRATRHLSRGIRHAIFLTRSDRTRLLSLTGHLNCRAIGGLAAKAKLLTGIEGASSQGDYMPLRIAPRERQPWRSPSRAGLAHHVTP